MQEAFPFEEMDSIIHQNRDIILNGIFGTATPMQVGSAMAFAKYLGYVGITARNYLLFLKIIETNNKWIVDELIGDRDPRLLFSVIKPNRFLIERAFDLLAAWHPGQIYSKVLLSVLGIVEYSYYKADDGYSIYPVNITDLQNLGKFLDQGKDQLESTNAAILEILDRMSQLGEYARSLSKLNISKQSFNIRDGFFDNTKNLTDIIPQVLLIRLKREDVEISPTKEFFSFASKLKK